MSAAEILHLAADRIEAGGWTQGASGRRGTAYCALVAITLSSRSTSRPAALEALCKHLGLPGPDQTYQAYDIIAWNDAPERTKHEVLAALRAAAREEAS